MPQCADAEDLRRHLARFGLSTFRPGQEEVIRAVLAGQDCLCIMPTGGGKSLCYQLPAIARPGVTLVVSPLIALMKDQVDQLTAIGVSATYINSTLTVSEQRERLMGMAAGRYDLIYIAPERMRNPQFAEAAQETQIQLLAVDEAHCISEWGHDFRPDYARIGRLREKLGRPQTIALTATATPDVRRDVVELLQLTEPRVFISGFARPNLRFRVEHASGTRDKLDRLVATIHRAGGPGIVYAATRKGCDEIAAQLAAELRMPVGLYHAGLLPDERREVQEQFMRGELPVIVATNAFGMGINKTDLRYVVHFNMPGTLEAYYQESGRAGRDGLPAECLLLFSFSDRYIQEFFIDNNYPSRETVAAVWEYLRAQREDPIEVTLQELRERLDLGVGTEGISSCEQILEKAGALKRLDAQQNRASVWLESDLPTLCDLLPREAKTQRTVLEAIERIVGDRRYERVTFQLERLAAMTSLERGPLNRALRELTKLEAFDYVPPFRGRAIHILKRDAPFSRLEIDFAEMERRKAAEYEKLERMVAYAQSRRCRQWDILDYFGDPEGKACGSCDNCGAPGLGARNGHAAFQASEQLVRTVRIALSGVARANGRFGKQMIAAMLAGSQSAKVIKNRLDQLSTFGLLRAFKQQDILMLLDELQRQNLIQQSDVDRYRPVVQLTSLGGEVMRGTAPLPATFVPPEPLAAKLGGTAPTDASPAPEAAPGHHSALFDMLRRWRAEKAEEQGLPHYRIVPTSVLELLASRCPTNTVELLTLRGIGPATIDRYGDELLALIRRYRAGPAEPYSDPDEDTETDSDAEPNGRPKSASSRPRTWDDAPLGDEGLADEVSTSDAEVDEADVGDPQTYSRVSELPDCYWTWRLLSHGFRPRECASIRRLALSEIFEHARLAAERGWDVDLNWLFSAEQLEILGDLNDTATESRCTDPRLAALPPRAIAVYRALRNLH